MRNEAKMMLFRDHDGVGVADTTSRKSFAENRNVIRIIGERKGLQCPGRIKEDPVLLCSDNGAPFCGDSFSHSSR